MSYESDLIVDAMSRGAPPRRRKKVMKPIFDSGFSVSGDPVFKPTRRVAAKKSKSVGEWVSRDFVVYLKKSLSHFGIDMEDNAVRDSDWVKKVYDLLVDELGDDMDNYVLRDYIDWWVGTYALARCARPIGVFSLMREQDARRFVRQRPGNRSGPKGDDVAKTEQQPDISPTEMYELSGIDMVMMSHGIVEAYLVLSNKQEKGVYTRLSNILKGYSKQVLAKVMGITLAKRYNTSDVVDFMSVARPALKFHGIEKQFDHVNYKQYFKEA